MTEIILSPFSNNALRDWPIGHYAALAEMLLDRIDTGSALSVIGTRGQRSAASEIVRKLPAERARNLCGLDWSHVIGRVRGAGCVVGNNSGIVHLARHLGRPTVCIFGGSHQRTEWGPLGPNAIILSREIACSPCQRNHIWECPYGVACLRDISPMQVADAVLQAVSSQRRTNVSSADQPLEKGIAAC